MLDALRRQLANDEPKCANCGNWARDARASTLGSCKIIMAAMETKGAEVPEGHGKDLFIALAMSLAATLDLSLCSKWERKSATPAQS